ncbi:hypothetical protein BC828DRAFT_416324 [Blastocladiella britannica]|nr:hypothetical protein BC828DRAFT_416324 [Blastocladiella britannica]
MERLPTELIAGILAAATPASCLSAATAELSHVARDSVPVLAWADSILAGTTNAIMHEVAQGSPFGDPRTSPALATFFATPRLRPVPEALQVPLVFLLRGELDQFKDALGIDDQCVTRGVYSNTRDEGDNDPPLEHRCTLPFHWATIAAARGQASVLEFMVAEGVLDPHAFMQFLSQNTPKDIVIGSPIRLSTEDRVLPTWRWLETLVFFFLEHDRPWLQSIADLRLRQVQCEHLCMVMQRQAAQGHHDLVPALIELEIFTAPELHELLNIQSRDGAAWTLFSNCGFGMDYANYGPAIMLAYDLRPESFPAMVARHFHQVRFLRELMAIPQVQPSVGYDPQVTSVLGKIIGYRRNQQRPHTSVSLLPAVMDNPETTQQMTAGLHAWTATFAARLERAMASANNGGTGTPNNSDDLWTADPPTAAAAVLATSTVKASTDSEQLQYQSMWIVARIAVLSPAVVLLFPAEFSVHTPAWLWQLRLDAVRTGATMAQQWRTPLVSWPAIVASNVDHGRSVAAGIVLQLLAIYSAFDQSAQKLAELRAIAETRPEVKRLAVAAGLAGLE